MWNRSPDTAVLTRESGVWLINGAHPVRPDAIEVLLETLYRVRLRGFAPDAATANILSAMSTYGTHVDVFAGEENLKSFTVGPETPDIPGTYFLRDGFGRPVAVPSPGLTGFFSLRFFLRAGPWRARTRWALAGVSSRARRARRSRPVGRFPCPRLSTCCADACPVGRWVRAWNAGMAVTSNPSVGRRGGGGGMAFMVMGKKDEFLRPIGGGGRVLLKT